MNLDSTPAKKPKPANDEFLFDDFDFKPITSGLGFHHKQGSEVKPAFTERALPQVPTSTPYSLPKNEMNVYQNDLSIFYGQPAIPAVPNMAQPEPKEEKVYRLASRPQRVLAYFLDLTLVLSVLGLVLTVMARTISMDLLEVWMSFPHEITPLVLTLFVGFYVIYFSIFEKSASSTLGKNILGLKVVDSSHSDMSFMLLLLRSMVTLLNFITLGLFSYFDLQSKVTNSKVIKVD